MQYVKTFFEQLPMWIATLIVVFGALSTACTILANAVRAVNVLVKQAWLDKVAAVLDKGGVELVWVGNFLTSLKGKLFPPPAPPLAPPPSDTPTVGEKK